MRIGPRAAGAYLHPNAALRPRLTAWDATVAEREEGFTEVAELLPFGVALTSGEIRPFVGPAFLAPGSRFIALPEQMVAAIGPQAITAASAEGQFSLETPGEHHLGRSGRQRPAARPPTTARCCTGRSWSPGPAGCSATAAR